MKSFIAVLCITLAAALVMRVAVSQNAGQQHVGPLPGGGFLLNSGWTIRPAGKQVAVDTLPMRTALSNNGKFLLVLNAGYNLPSVSVINIAQQKEIGRTTLPDAWLGLTVVPRDNRVFVGGASKGVVYELELDPGTGALTRKAELAAVPEVSKPGLSFIGDVAVSPDAHLLYAADLYMDSVAVINLQSGILIERWKSGRRPYRLLLPPDGKSLFVSSWADAAVYQYNANSGNQVSVTRVGPHPTDMLWLNKPAPTEDNTSTYVARLFVAAANTNNVYSIGVTSESRLKAIESINFSMTPLHPLGMTPTALGIDREGKRLYAVCSDANAVGVADISTPLSHVSGFIPTAWYPTAVRSLEDGQLLIVSGKGLGSRANPDGPVPTQRPAPLHEGGPATWPGYAPHYQLGTVAFLPPVADEQLQTFTRTTQENSPYRDELLEGRPRGPVDAEFTTTESHASPIRHVIYVIKENRTYDQVLGDLEKGNGDKSLNLFGEQITPNLHQLAREFILYDNFYENADVSADGHNWSSAGIAPDYTVKMWPNSYAGRRKTYDYEGGEPANTPPAGYIWNNAIQKGLTVRSYGEWAENIPLKTVTGPRQIAKSRDATLTPFTDMNYRGFDLDYSDIDRAKEFLREWNEFDLTGQAPNLMIVRMGNDHTKGAAAGQLTPLAYNANNDQGIGLLVEGVSHSKLWASTAFFIIEDDAQNGPDHVDSHRAPAWVLSPYTHRGLVDSTMYNQTSILRTIELIVGLRPMTHFDAAATPMFANFAQQADLRPFNAIAPKTSLTDRNPGKTLGAVASARMDFSDADRADDDELNAVIWRSIKQTDPPPPVRSAFAK